MVPRKSFNVTLIKTQYREFRLQHQKSYKIVYVILKGEKMCGNQQVFRRLLINYVRT